MQPTSSIKCPYCLDVLYTSINDEQGRILSAPPKFEFEYDVKPFIDCPHCLKRVYFESVPVPHGKGSHIVLKKH